MKFFIVKLIFISYQAEMLTEEQHNSWKHFLSFLKQVPLTDPCHSKNNFEVCLDQKKLQEIVRVSQFLPHLTNSEYTEVIVKVKTIIFPNFKCF